MYPLKIHLYRKRAGLTQQQLADQIGIHVTTLSKIERGARHLSEPNERRIVAALALPPDEVTDMLGLPRLRRRNLRLVGASAC